MTLFGTTLDGMQIAQLVGLLAVLALWIFAFRGARGYERWVKGWSNEKKAEATKKNEAPKRTPTGPWG
ncbi:hypothetical protein [Brevundimonas aurifodinae]|uniref:Uncharacterized protein n=2 Tax=Brevundimonas TaxID=41275 RepID=A0ABV1NRT9_9CAUL|nr:MAG: hypothetical protein B7Z01_08415 [Brevundimonas subvibrioides]